MDHLFSKFAFAALLTAFTSPVFAADVAGGKTAGSSSGGLAVGTYGTKNSIKNNVTLPMTGGGSLMKTVDGRQSFDATMSAPSSGQFLEILMQPSATGDLSMVTVGQDTDGNGSLDHSFVLGVPVSGICANGFISCNPGTWNACTTFGWTASAGKASFINKAVSDVGGCYCINSSCGSRLVWDNSAVVLQGLGGGVVAAIQENNATAMVTEVQSDAISVRYFGRVVSDTPIATTTTPTTAAAVSAPHAQAFFNSPANLTAAKDNISTTQGSNQDSMYYKMTNSAAFAGSTNTKTCTIRVDGGIASTTDASYSDSGTTQLYTDHYIDMQIWRSPDKQRYKLQLLDHYSGITHKGIAGNPSHEPMDDNGWHTIHEFVLPLDSSRVQSALSTALFSLKIVGGSGCVAGSQYTIDGMVQGFNNRINVGGYCSGGGVQRPSLEWSYLFEYQSDTYSESVSNECIAIDADSTCKLRNEKVDGFTTTVRNYNNTGLRSLPSSRIFTGAVGNIEIFKDWWQKDREYVCDTGAGWDLSAVKERYGTIGGSATSANGVLNYSDKRMVNGSWQAVDSSISLGEGDNYSECVNSCKVQRPRHDSQVSMTGVSAMRRNDQTAYDTYYLPCETDIICPVIPGDVVITDCSCLNEFGTAASVMQLMRLGGGDSICSDGTAKQL